MDTETKGLIKRTVEGLSAQIVSSLSVSEHQRSHEPLKDEIAARQMILAEIRCQIKALKARQNDLLPIHRLPVEILSIILSMALPLKRYHKERTKLLLVCRIWAKLIDQNTPTFWTTLSSEDPHSQRARLLLKSNRMPVTLVTGSRYAGSKAADDFVKYIRSIDIPFRELVIRELCEDSDEVMEAVFAGYLAAPAPHLRSLDLEVENGWLLEGGDPNSQHLKMFSGVAPNLKSVRLFGVCIPWNSAILRGLVSFSLECPDYCAVGTPSLEDLLRILQDCPALQSLTLLWHKTFDHSNQSAMVLPRVSLDQLESINLSTSSLQSNLSLLRHIRFPRTTTVRIEKQYFTPLEDDDEVLNATLSMLQQNLSIQSFQLGIYRSRLRFSATGLEFSFQRSWWKHDKDYRTCKETLFRLSSPIRTAITFLDMDCFPREDSTDPLFAANKFLSNLTHLSVHHRDSILNSYKLWNVVLEEIVQPIEDTGRPTWLCPQLAWLELLVTKPNYLDLAAVLELVRMRDSDVESNGKQVIRAPIVTTIHITFVYGRLSPDQMDLLNELKSEVADVKYVIERDEVQSEYDSQSDSESP